MDWQKRLSRADAPAIPVFVANMNGGKGRTWYITPKQYKIAVIAGSGPVRSTVRDIAKRTGIARSTVQQDIVQLDRLGILKRYVKRGRYGFTRFLLRLDVFARRVMSVPQEPRVISSDRERGLDPKLEVRTYVDSLHERRRSERATGGRPPATI